jgi:hypothetical protein
MHAVESRKSALDKYFARADAVQDGEIQADLAKLGAVLVCGFVERAVEIIVMERIDRRAQDRVKNFIKSHFRKGTNYDCRAICGLVERFEPSWSAKMKNWMDANAGPVESLTSVYGLRNSIAHGGGQSASLRRVRDYAEHCKMVVDALIVATR